MRIVFMGTPAIAATCLESLLKTGHHVVGVYTKPDTPKNRGMKMAMSEVKETALAAELPVYQPTSFREAAVVEELRALQPDLIAVVAYGKILPQSVLDIPQYGCVNIHASILPELRGSAPVQWSILNGFTQTGVTAMYMAAELDAGDIIAVEKTPIDPTENSAELLARLAVMGGDLLCKTVEEIFAGTANRIPQDSAMVTYAPMLSKDMSPIDWEKSAAKIIDQVRGLIPWPVATAQLQEKRFKIYGVEPAGYQTERAPGSLLQLTKRGLEVACGDGEVLVITQLQAEGGKRMAAPDYFRGHPIELN